MEDTPELDRAEQKTLVDRLTRLEIDAAIQEHDNLGLEPFLKLTGFTRPQVWVANSEDTQRYPAKATVAAAIRHLPDGPTLTSKTFFEGYGEKEAFEKLKSLGYRVFRPNAGHLPQENDKFSGELGSQTAVNPLTDPLSSLTPPATNLILYGPPGTGKTYATAAEAVRLCGEPVPEDRTALMSIYRRLLEAGRIEFITFHQSTSYEEFVEGRQPETRSDGGDGSKSIGLRLITVPGIFRRISEHAENSQFRQGGTSSENRRQVFKMSIGRSDLEEESKFFEEAINGGYTLLGWENIDWSNEKYSDASEILEACRNANTNPGSINAQSGQVRHTDIFRNRMMIGDIIIVSKGNSLFRAIGEVTGEYEYFPRPEGVMCHKRSVNWLWSNREGIPAPKINNKNFTQATIYKLNNINISVLEEYVSKSQIKKRAASKSFVLIIDEINRANISKVFGELITLLEADKRLGQHNALQVRLPYSQKNFGVPSNLHILGTMNTADRSIALLDTALRRRFTFREIMPDASILKDAGQKCGIDLPRLLSMINERIEYLYDREHQIGHAYFTACHSRAEVDEVMRHKVIPLLAEYFFEDWAKIAAVLGDLEAHEGAINGGFLRRSILKAPPGLDYGDAPPRYRWEVRSVDEGFDYRKLVGA